MISNTVSIDIAKHVSLGAWPAEHSGDLLICSSWMHQLWDMDRHKEATIHFSAKPVRGAYEFRFHCPDDTYLTCDLFHCFGKIPILLLLLDVLKDRLGLDSGDSFWVWVDWEVKQ